MPRLRPLPSRTLSLLASMALGIVGTAGASGAVSAAAESPGSAAVGARASVTVEVVRSGLDIPWDIAFIDATHYLLTERPGRIWLGSTDPADPLRLVNAPLGDLSVSGEAGLLGLAIHPAFATNRQFFTCQSHLGPTGGPSDMRVLRWRLSPDGSRATRVGVPVVKGIQLHSFHIGCRVVVGPDGKLWISTGDAGSGTAPQDKASLSGKILRSTSTAASPRTTRGRGNAAMPATSGTTVTATPRGSFSGRAPR